MSEDVARALKRHGLQLEKINAQIAAVHSRLYLLESSESSRSEPESDDDAATMEMFEKQIHMLGTEYTRLEERVFDLEEEIDARLASNDNRTVCAVAEKQATPPQTLDQLGQALVGRMEGGELLEQSTEARLRKYLLPEERIELEGSDSSACLPSTSRKRRRASPDDFINLKKTFENPYVRWGLPVPKNFMWPVLPSKSNDLHYSTTNRVETVHGTDRYDRTGDVGNDFPSSPLVDADMQKEAEDEIPAWVERRMDKGRNISKADHQRASSLHSS